MSPQQTVTKTVEYEELVSIAQLGLLFCHSLNHNLAKFSLYLLNYTINNEKYSFETYVEKHKERR